MRLTLLASLIVLLGAAPAWASGGVACSSESGQAKFEVSAAMGRDFGSGIFDLNGTLEAAIPGVAKELQRVRFSLETPHQLWLDRDLLYFELMAARLGDGPYGSSDLVIKTTAVDEGTFEGRYTLTITDSAVDAGGEAQNIEISGTVSCIAD
ncbi:MAG: hypothetical protein ABI414_06695 [Devosia sp.]